MFIMCHGTSYVHYGPGLCSLWDLVMFITCHGTGLCSLHAMGLVMFITCHGTGFCSLWDWVMFIMGLGYVQDGTGLCSLWDLLMLIMCHGTRLCSLCARVLGGLCSLCAMRLTRKILHLQYVQLEGYSCHLQFSSLQPMFNVYKWSKQNT